MQIRARFVFFIFIIAFGAAAGRLFVLQTIRAEHYQKEAERQQQVSRDVQAKRGAVYLRSSPSGSTDQSIPVALTARSWDVWVSPKNISPGDRASIAQKISEILGLNYDTVLERVSKENDPYEPLKEGVDEETVEKLSGLGQKSIGWEKTDSRLYPLGQLGSHVIGFVSKKKEVPSGQYGLEEFYNESLSGVAGFIDGARSPLGALIRPLATFAEAEDGMDLYLTLDYNIQRAVESYLESARTKLEASSVSAIVLNPGTGEVRALASTPSFDPNSYNEVKDISLFINPLTQNLFEPGSIFKPITMAVGLDINVISPGLTYYDEGSVRVGDRTIKNSGDRKFGVQTMTNVLERSLNTGSVFVVQKIPAGVWREYLENFGLSKRTGIDLAAEALGDIKNLSSGGEVERATSSFGQGIAVTPIALTSAIGAIANDGKLMKPYLVDRVTSGGEVRSSSEPKLERQVIRPDVAESVTKMLVSVVENGSGRNAKIDGYAIAGKTGTAQVPGPSGGYSERVIHSFVGFAPAFDPTFVALVTINDPKGSEFSESTAAPLFREIAQFILNYDGVEPEVLIK